MNANAEYVSLLQLITVAPVATVALLFIAALCLAFRPAVTAAGSAVLPMATSAPGPVTHQPQER